MTMMTQKEKSNGRYATLEHELRSKDESYDYATLLHMVVQGDSRVEEDYGSPEYMRMWANAVGESLGLGEDAVRELESVSEDMIAPLLSRIDEMRDRNDEIARGRAMGTIDERHNSAISAEKSSLVGSFAEEMSGRMMVEGVADKRLIKSVIVYPVLMAELNSWKLDGGFDLSERVVRAMKEVEKDGVVRGFIDDLDMPITLRAS